MNDGNPYDRHRCGELRTPVPEHRVILDLAGLAALFELIKKLPACERGLSPPWPCEACDCVWLSPCRDAALGAALEQVDAAGDRRDLGLDGAQARVVIAEAGLGRVGVKP
jgi:hypothetical protein